MVYKYCDNKNFEDLASGRVIAQRAGFPNFPVRLAQEIFGRCCNYLGTHNRLCIYDPCCGGGYLLTTLGFLNYEKIETIVASDISGEAIQLANENLSLLRKEGLKQRIEQLNHLYLLHHKVSHGEALGSAANLLNILTNATHEIRHEVFKTDILSKAPFDQLHFKADIIFTDVPYGNLVEWQKGNADHVNLLDQLLPVIKAKGIVAICSDKSQKFHSEHFQRLEKQAVGKRLFQIFRAGGGLQLMNKEELYAPIREKYEALKAALRGTDLGKIRELTLEVHAMVHPAEISGRAEKTIADYVLDYMLAGNQNEVVPREDYDVDLHYAGTRRVPMCWQFWHTYRIEDLVSNILMVNQNQIFNARWQEKIGASITDTGNALEFDEAVEFGKGINVYALRDYMITVGKNTRSILESLTLEQIQSMVPEEWVMRILEEGGVTTDFRSVWLLVFWGRLTRGGMILTPMTDHHMMHLPPCLNHLPILGEG